MTTLVVFFALSMAAALALAMSAGAADPLRVPSARPGEQYPNIAVDGAWCWFADPRAVYHQGRWRRTYIGWVNRAGDIVVAAYDHDSGQMHSHTLRAALEVDDHANPAILIRPDGRLTVFYSAHNGGAMYHRTSRNPEDILVWDDERTVETNTAGSRGYTYPNPCLLSQEAGRLFLFWRGGDWSVDFAASDDLGATWTPARALIRVPDHRPYVKFASDGRGCIHFAFTDGHPRNLFNNIYHAFYEGGAIRRADGTRVASLAELPIHPADAGTVYDARAHGAHAWIWDIALDAAGLPVIVYATFPDSGNHHYRYARWTGREWQDRPVCAAGPSIDGPSEVEYSGGIVLDHADPSIVYLSSQVNGTHEIQRWITADGGATWRAEPITAGSRQKNVRPVVPRGRPAGGGAPDLAVLWMHGDYPHYTQYATSIKGWPMGPGGR